MPTVPTCFIHEAHSCLYRSIGRPIKIYVYFVCISMCRCLMMPLSLRTNGGTSWCSGNVTHFLKLLLEMETIKPEWVIIKVFEIDGIRRDKAGSYWVIFTSTSLLHQDAFLRLRSNRFSQSGAKCKCLVGFEEISETLWLKAMCPGLQLTVKVKPRGHNITLAPGNGLKHNSKCKWGNRF